MIIPGLVSITFRKLTVPEIIHLVRTAQLKSIEWGGDVHVPPGNPEAARDVRRHTEDAGLSVAAYGSYYRVGKSPKEQPAFEEVLESARELQAPTVRVWAGTAGSAETEPAARKKIVRETRRIAALAKEAEITVSFEFHRNTLTDTNDSAAVLLQEVDHTNVFSLWQPPVGASRKYALEGLRLILPRLTNVHAFNWSAEGTDRLPLADGASRWHSYLEVLHSTGRNHHVLLEFVREDDPGNFLKDAATLRQWLSA
jgi:3-dehydroshikimate dehydratase